MRLRNGSGACPVDRESITAAAGLVRCAQYRCALVTGIESSGAISTGWP